MNLQQLEYFRAVAEHLHFTHAARSLNTAQPHVSREIRRLEHELGAELFSRSTRRVSLTPAGVALLERATTIFNELDSAAEVVRAIHHGRSGRVAVGFAGSTTYSWLPYLVKSYRHHFPEVDLQIHTEMFTGEQVDALLNNRIDVGLLRPPFDNDEVETAEIASEPLVLAVPADHPLSDGEDPVRLEALRTESFITYGGHNSVTQKTVLGACLRAGFVPNTVQTVFETHSVVSLVAAGLGVALAPHSVRFFTVEGVRYRAVADNNLRLPLALGWRRTTTNQAALNFVALAQRLSDRADAPRAG